jgi:hypothetical protein
VKTFITKCTVVLAATAIGATALGLGAGSATAPAPAQLNFDLAGEWTYATYLNTDADPTYGFKQSTSWVNHPWMGNYPGYPCIDPNAPARTVLYGYLITHGNWARCSSSGRHTRAEGCRHGAGLHLEACRSGAR